MGLGERILFKLYPYRTTHSVKHFPVDWDREEGVWTFGQETFTCIPAFLEHFDNRPLLGDEGGEFYENSFIAR